MSDKKTTIIETRAQSILRDVIHQVVAGAGLALVRGPAGIGKTFALDLIEDELVEAGVRVIRVTATPAIEGSLSAFAREALAEYRVEAASTMNAVESLWSLLEGYPFRDYGPRTLFMVDESQGLKTSILEMIRALWDRGTHARLGMASGPAFGCVLVGNDQFMSKGGHVRTASFRPLLSRVTHTTCSFSVRPRLNTPPWRRCCFRIIRNTARCWKGSGPKRATCGRCRWRRRRQASWRVGKRSRLTTCAAQS
jgi:type II secretory pathway predicted ATPase ExeA